MTQPEGDRQRIARVVVDSPLPHLDQPFDYLIPDKLSRVRPGFRVRVPFAGRLVNAVVLAVDDTTEFGGRLLDMRSAAYAESYTPESLRLAEALARRAGGSVWDVLRLMAPPRVAAVEKREAEHGDPRPRLEAAAERLTARGEGEAPAHSPRWKGRSVLQALPDPEAPGATPARLLASEAVAAAASGEGSAILVVPDARAVRAVSAMLREAGLERWTPRGGGEFAVLDADDGPQVRYGQYLAALRGEVPLVIGTRPTAMQPVPRLAAMVMWDDAHTAYEDPHAPYLHARTVANVRTELEGNGLVLAAYAPSIEAVSLAEHGWAELVAPSADEVRQATATVDVWDDARREEEGPAGRHWMPPGVWRRANASLAHGPVAIVVPRAGYVAATACARCDAWAECRECGSSLSLPAAGDAPVCVACAHVHVDWHCPHCHGARLAHRRQGIGRIGEQLSAMAGDTPVSLSSGASGVLDDGAVTEGFVVATPGALPAAPGGYGHVVVVDAGVPAGGLGGEIVALRHWLVAAAHARPRSAGGGVSIVGELPALTTRALASWRAAEAAQEAYQERRELGLPPFTRHLRVDGPRVDVSAALRASRAEEQGALVARDDDGASILSPRGAAQGCVDALRETVREQSKAGREPLRVRVDGPLRLQ
ncbi:hypothetical protein [Demequina zhanjiangensis]|uniref:Primosomal protein N' 3' DNA-binding domain-containing protein n=1 Tax=Demequina zhanjiangensis TaxID=3051659 RepID=A0ABT8G3Q6_9MICO|nr:hypothetical protein [Demequina sp. SYSU T00b26]MDN4473329.1 hypothetical protein [Demequina sp. SYSU T00b26]